MTFFDELKRKQAAESFLQKKSNLIQFLDGAKQIVDQLTIYRRSILTDETFKEEDIQAIDEQINIIAQESLAKLKNAFEGTDTLKGTIKIEFRGNEV